MGQCNSCRIFDKVSQRHGYGAELVYQHAGAELRVPIRRVSKDALAPQLLTQLTGASGPQGEHWRLQLTVIVVRNGRALYFGNIADSTDIRSAKIAADRMSPPEHPPANHPSLQERFDYEGFFLEHWNLEYAKGRELTSITGRVLLSRFTDGLDDLRKFKAAHGNEKWLHEVEGDFTGPLLRSPDEQFDELRSALGFDAILDYDAQGALRRARTPMLWIVAGKDTEAPPVLALEFLRTLQAAPTQLDIAVFPNADHGIIEDDRQSAGYHDLLAAWIRTRKLDGKFGTAVLIPDTGRLHP